MQMPSSPLSPTAALQRGGYKAQVLAQIKDTLKVLRAVFDDVDVNEIMINAPQEVFIFKQGRKQRLNVDLGKGEIEAAITLIASLSTKEVGDKSGKRILSARLPGFRVEAMLPPVAVKGPSMCIRRHSSQVFTLDDYIAQGVISEKYATLLADVIANEETFLIAGGTGSGKTTLMNTALSLLPKDERIFVVETVPELQIKQEDHVLVECDHAIGAATPREAVRIAMRYFIGRIFLGELRGPEAWDWCDAANTGHKGSGATIHANGASRALPRLENLVMMADMGVPYEAMRASLAETVQWMFYIRRDGKNRQVTEVTRVHGFNRATSEYELETF